MWRNASSVSHIIDLSIGECYRSFREFQMKVCVMIEANWIEVREKDLKELDGLMVKFSSTQRGWEYCRQLLFSKIILFGYVWICVNYKNNMWIRSERTISKKRVVGETAVWILISCSESYNIAWARSKLLQCNCMTLHCRPTYVCSLAFPVLNTS